MVLELKEYTMASLGQKLSYTTLITPNQTEPSPPYNTKTDGPPPFLHLVHFFHLRFLSLSGRSKARARRRRPTTTTIKPFLPPHFSSSLASLILTSFVSLFLRSCIFSGEARVFRRVLGAANGGLLRSMVSHVCSSIFFIHSTLSTSFPSLFLYFGFLFGLHILVADFRRATRRPAAGGPFSLTVSIFAHSSYLSFCDLHRLRVRVSSGCLSLGDLN